MAVTLRFRVTRPNTAGVAVGVPSVLVKLRPVDPPVFDGGIEELLYLDRQGLTDASGVADFIIDRALLDPQNALYEVVYPNEDRFRGEIPAGPGTFTLQDLLDDHGWTRSATQAPSKSIGYDQVFNASTAIAQRKKLRVDGTLLAAADDSVNGWTTLSAPGLTPITRTITGADGCAGGGDLSADRTITLPAVGPGAGTIGGGANVVTSITLDAKGRVTAATAGAGGSSIGPGTAGKLAVFTGAGTTVGDSILSESGSVLVVTENPFGMRTTLADGATAVGAFVDTSTAWVNGGAKLLSLRNNGVEKAYFDLSGALKLGGDLTFPKEAEATLSVAPSTTANEHGAGLTIVAGHATPGGNGNGGDLFLTAGFKEGAGTGGEVVLSGSKISLQNAASFNENLTIATTKTIAVGANTIVSGDKLVSSMLDGSRSISAGAGLTGGGTLAADRTISMPNVGPGAGTIGGGGNIIESVTLDVQGRVTAATTTAAGGGAPDDAAYLTNGAVAGLSAEVNVQALTSGQLVFTGPGSGTPIVTQFRPRSDVDEVITIRGGDAGNLMIAASDVAYSAVKPLQINASMVQTYIASTLRTQHEANRIIPVDLGLSLGDVNNRWNGFYNGSFTEFSEIAEPAAPGANKGRLFVQDNGAGKSQLCIRFASGASQVLATEP